MSETDNTVTNFQRKKTDYFLKRTPIFQLSMFMVSKTNKNLP